MKAKIPIAATVTPLNIALIGLLLPITPDFPREFLTPFSLVWTISLFLTLRRAQNKLRAFKNDLINELINDELKINPDLPVAVQEYIRKHAGIRELL